MQTLHVRLHTDSRAEATIALPREFANLEIDAVVVLAPEATVKASGWPDGLFEATAGAWQGDPLVRPLQGNADSRHPLE